MERQRRNRFILKHPALHHSPICVAEVRCLCRTVRKLAVAPLVKTRFSEALSYSSSPSAVEYWYRWGPPDGRRVPGSPIGDGAQPPAAATACRVSPLVASSQPKYTSPGV